MKELASSQGAKIQRSELFCSRTERSEWTAGVIAPSLLRWEKGSLCGASGSVRFTWQQDSPTSRDRPPGHPGKLGCQILQPLRRSAWGGWGRETHTHTLACVHACVRVHSNSQNPSVILPALHYCPATLCLIPELPPPLPPPPSSSSSSSAAVSVFYSG